MNRNAKIALIIFAVLTLVFAAGGVYGLVTKIADEKAKPSMGEQALIDINAYDIECQEYMNIAQEAQRNLDTYVDAIEQHRDYVAGFGGDTAEYDGLLEQAEGIRQEANTALEAMTDRYSKITEKVIEPSKAEGVEDDQLKTMASQGMSHRNKMRTEFEKITKRDQYESSGNESAETKMRRLYGKSLNAVKQFKTETPDCAEAEIPAVYDLETEMPYAFQTAPAVPKSVTFREYLQGIWDKCFWIAGLFLLGTILALIGVINPDLLKKIGAAANKNMMLIALVGITVVFFVLTDYKLLTPTNVSNLIDQNAYIIVLACGMLLCIVCSGNIDLSVGRVMGFVGACAAKFMIEGNMPVPLGIGLCLLIGLAIGAWQGFWIAYMKIPAFIVTLAGQLTFYGLTMMILNGFTIAGFPDMAHNAFASFMGDPLSAAFGVDWSINLFAIAVGALLAIVIVILQIRNRVSRKKKGYSLEPVAAMVVRTVLICGVLIWLFYSLAKANGIPTVLITVAIVLAIYAFITSKTVMGRHLYAMGGNVNAARLSGVKSQKMLFLAYVNMGLLAALAGLVYAARLNSASPQAGSGDELYAIASCYIGGASAYGGIGTIGGALIGALTMGVIKNGMSIAGMSMYVQQMVLGLVLLFAVVIDVVSKQKGSIPFLNRAHGKKHKAGDKAALK